MSAKATHGEVGRAQFTKAMRRMASSVAVVAASHDGRRSGLAVTTVTSVSVDPPTLLICVNRAASAFPVIQAAGRFSVNVLSREQQGVCSAFGGRYTQEERFAQSPWDADESGTPFLPNSQVSMVCRVVQELLYATHSIFIAEVETSAAREDVDPLLYADGRYGTVHFQATA